MVVALRMEMMEAPTHIATAIPSVAAANSGGKRISALPDWLRCEISQPAQIATRYPISALMKACWMMTRSVVPQAYQQGSPRYRPDPSVLSPA